MSSLGFLRRISQSKSVFAAISSNMCTATGVSPFETLAVKVPKPFVYHVELNRPNNLNAFNKTMWFELSKCFGELDSNPDCRVVVLSASGKHFTAGIDLVDMLSFAQDLAKLEDTARKAKYLYTMITNYQKSVSALESCSKPVVVAVHSACVGAGVDLITAADIRYCSQDAWFQVKEVDIGMAADVGTLQRLPKVIGNMSLVRELCYTARKLKADEAQSCGLVSKVFPEKTSLLKGALEVAEEIASKSPVGIQMTKKALVYSLDHTNQEGLEYIALVNQLMLQSEDFVNACMAQATKGDRPVFAKL